MAEIGSDRGTARALIGGRHDVLLHLIAGSRESLLLNKHTYQRSERTSLVPIPCPRDRMPAVNKSGQAQNMRLGMNPRLLKK